jgi:hypothetical protein
MTIGETGYAPEGESHCPAQNVSGLPSREKQRLPRGEFEPERVEVELHLSRYYTGPGRRAMVKDIVPRSLATASHIRRVISACMSLHSIRWNCSST